MPNISAWYHYILYAYINEDSPYIQSAWEKTIVSLTLELPCHFTRFLRPFEWRHPVRRCNTESLKTRQILKKRALCLLVLRDHMMTSSNGNIFRVTGHLCGEFTGPGEFLAQRPVARSFDVFFDLRLNKRLSKQSWGWWFEMLARPLWCHCNVRAQCWKSPDLVYIADRHLKG